MDHVEPRFAVDRAQVRPLIPHVHILEVGVHFFIPSPRARPGHLPRRARPGACAHARVEADGSVRGQVVHEIVRLPLRRVVVRRREALLRRIEDAFFHVVVERGHAALAAGTEVAHERAVLPDLQPVEARAAPVVHGPPSVVAEEVEAPSRIVGGRIGGRIDRLAVHDERLAARLQFARDRVARTRGIRVAVVALERTVRNGHAGVVGMDQHHAVVPAIRPARVQEAVVPVHRQPFQIGLAARARPPDHLRVHVGVAAGLHVLDELVRHVLVGVVDEVRPRVGVEDRPGDGVIQAHAPILHARPEVAHERAVQPDLHPVAPGLRHPVRHPLDVAGEQVEVRSRVDQVVDGLRDIEGDPVDRAHDLADLIRRCRRHRLLDLASLAGRGIFDEIRDDGLRRHDFVGHGEVRLHRVRSTRLPETVPPSMSCSARCPIVAAASHRDVPLASAVPEVDAAVRVPVRARVEDRRVGQRRPLDRRLHPHPVPSAHAHVHGLLACGLHIADELVRRLCRQRRR